MLESRQQVLYGPAEAVSVHSVLRSGVLCTPVLSVLGCTGVWCGEDIFTLNMLSFGRVPCVLKQTCSYIAVSSHMFVLVSGFHSILAE